MNRIDFYTEGIKPFRVRKRNLRNSIIKMIENEGFKCGEINIVFCGDEYLLKINIDFLQHDYFTDIITFDNSDGKVISGELFISIERIRENAIIFNVTTREELYRVIIHGLLHLAGYDDKDDERKRVMSERENLYLAEYLLNI